MNGPTPFAGATAVWHLGDRRPSRGAGELLVHGSVTLDAELPPADADASRRRGGDGRAARFAGGYLEIPPAELPDFAGGAMSLCLRLCDTNGTWQAPLFGSYGADDAVSFHLEGTDGAAKPFTITHGNSAHHTPCRDLFGTPGGPLAVTGSTALLECTWGTAPHPGIVAGLERRGCGEPLLGEARAGIMKVNVPVAHIGAHGWHDVVVRFTGPKLELFVDGVLVDEEFPIGATRPGTAPLLIGAAATADGIRAGFHGMVDHVALWDRALSDREIARLSGGRDEVARREVEILGPAGAQIQYWRPRGHNARAGDCMPFFDGETFHLYYLVVRRNHHGKWQSGHGGLQIWHASTRDLRRWQHHPIAVPISEQWQSWWGTGSFALHEGTWFTYQKGPSLLPEQPCGGVQLATSSDGIHFTAQPPHPALPGYDCDIHTDVATGVHHLLTTEDYTGREVAIVRWTSGDLRNWTRVAEPVLVTVRDEFNVDICPHLFEWNGWYYLFAGFDERGGVWVSRQPFGPWRLHRPVRLDIPTVPKTAPFPAGRRIFAGFLADRGWGGNVVFRELIQHGDGSLGTRLPPEMVPAAGPPAQLRFRPLTGGVTGNGSTVTLRAGDGAQAALTGGAPADARLRFTVTPEPDTLGPRSSFGVALRSKSGAAALTARPAMLRFPPHRRRHGAVQERVSQRGNGGAAPRAASSGVLRFHPHRERVSLSTTHVRPDGAVSEAVITDVTGLDHAVHVEVIMSRDIVDVCIDGRRTIIGRHWHPDADGLLWFASHATVAVTGIEAAPLLRA